MAYIPKDDDEQQSGMNVLASQGQQQNTQSDAQNQPQNISGGQSTTIGSGQAQQGSQGQSQAPKGQQKKAKSGMFTNIRKYMEQNKPGAQRMSGKLQQNVSQQNQNIQQAIGKQKNDFMSRVNQNRQRMQEAQQFGQQTLQSAQAQQSAPMLQQQQQDLQQRVDQFGNVVDQTQNINQTQQQIVDQQAAYQQAQQAYQQAQQQFQQQAQNFGQYVPQVQSGTTGNYQWQAGQQVNMGNVPTYYTQEQITQGLAGGNQDVINSIDNQINQDQVRIAQLEEAGRNSVAGLDPASMEEYQNLLQKRDSFQQYKTQLAAQQQAQQAQSGQLTQLESYQDQLGRAQEQQRLYQNKQNLEGELSQLQDQINNAPESLTEDDITRFNQLRTGIERFDDAILNLSEQKRGVEGLASQVGTLGTSQGRRDLMRQEFGRQGGYTSGQAALDNLILTGDPQAMRDLVQNSQAQAEQAQQALEQAFREGRVTQDEMARGTRQIQQDLQEGVEQAQTALQEGLAQRAETGEGTYIKELQDKLASGQGLSQQDMAILGITGQERFNQDPTELLRNLEIDPNQFGIQDVANLTDVARADALARLSGETVGQNTFLQEQLGIDQMGRQAIEARNLRADPAEEFTRTREELAPEDKAMVDDFVAKLNSGQVYQNVDQARNDIRNSVANSLNGNELEPVSNMIQSLVENGNVGTEYGNIDLNKVLAGDQSEAEKIVQSNYWAWAGMGQHGRVTPFHVIIDQVRKAHAQTQALKSAYGATNQNALRSEAQSAYVGQQPVNRIK